ncbi:hypothetical protein ACFFWD_08880 [Bradyrhizobium erythrophlei]|uniref:hypothetical protein n=1 Tax=Bradyrhizobium erythrophlei TaxID=1437360 RepID=UPI0035ED95F4
MMGHWMYGYGLGHGLWLVIVAAVVLYPTGRILSRMGFSPVWSILVFIPLFNLIGLWIVAFADWPANAGRQSLLNSDRNGISRS